MEFSDIFPHSGHCAWSPDGLYLANVRTQPLTAALTPLTPPHQPLNPHSSLCLFSPSFLLILRPNRAPSTCATRQRC